jgi:hypothetical protein
MYLTAQRVAQIEGPHYGINGFLFLHGDAELPVDTDGDPDLESIATNPPDEAVSAIESLPPGGNGVLSYLDVAAPDDCSTEKLKQALQQLEAFVPTRVDDSPFVDTECFGGVAVRIHLSTRTPLSPALEYRSLRESVLALLSDQRADLSHTSLRMSLEKAEDEWRFRPLTTDVELPGSPGSSNGHLLAVDHETLEAFERTRGSFFPAAAESIFGMDPEQLLEHGGVEIVGDRSGELVWRGP